MINTVDITRTVESATLYIKRLLMLIIAYSTLSWLIFSEMRNLVKNRIPLVEAASWLVPAMLIILIIEAGFIVITVSLARTGIKDFSKPAAIIGSVIISAAIWLDVLATIWVSPDLEREGNPFIMMFKAFHIPIWGLYLLGFLAQLGITVISCALWVSFVKHYQIYLQVLQEAEAKNLFQYLWVSFGGNLRSFKTRQKKFYSRLYRISWIILLSLIDPFSRLALGLEWLGVPIRKLIYPADPFISVLLLGEITSTIIQVAFILWLIYIYYVTRSKKTKLHLEKIIP